MEEEILKWYQHMGVNEINLEFLKEMVYSLQCLFDSN